MIRKVIIPAEGLGTRLFPAPKVQPKHAANFLSDAHTSGRKRTQ